MKTWLMMIVPLAGLGTGVHAEECFEIEHSIETSVQRLAFAKTSTTKGTDDKALIEHKFTVAGDEKAHISLQCPTTFTPYAVLMDDYDAELPAEGHFAILAEVASIVTHAPAAKISVGIQKCYDTAHAAEDHNSKFERYGLTFDCDVWPNGPVNITIAKHPSGSK